MSQQPSLADVPPPCPQSNSCLDVNTSSDMGSSSTLSPPVLTPVMTNSSKSGSVSPLNLLVTNDNEKDKNELNSPCLNPKGFKPAESTAKEEWARRKVTEPVKKQFLDVKSQIDICKEQGRSLSSERFSIVFRGNPGTESLNVFEVDEWTQEAISGVEVVNRGPQEIERMIKRMIRGYDHGGVLIIDEAYQLLSPQAGLVGRSALDIILNLMETNVGKLAVIFLGYKEEMEPFFEHNPGLSSRIPYMVDFDDYTDYELWKIMCKNITDHYQGKMDVEGGMDGLYMRCIIRRLSAARGKKGFGNVRAVQNLLNLITQRQARRLVKERRDGQEHNCHLLTKDDLLGPNPSAAIMRSQAWHELKCLIGLEQVKESVKSLINSIEVNYQREMHEFRPISFSLNQVFIGEPGTGKTTVARLYGRILADLGYLSRGDVVFKTPADFIGDCLGKSETRTRQILDASVGKVLIIDEAYMLDPGNQNGDHDKFKSGVIDTIVSIVQGSAFEDRCIILVGYEDKMRTMFHNANPGLSRRFPIKQPFRFASFTIEQLMSILRSKMTDQDLDYSDDALAAACEIFKGDMRGNRTNAGIVDNALETAKLNYSRRLSKTPFDPQNPNPKFEAVDFDLNVDSTARVNCRKEMQGQIDLTIIERLEGYQKRHWKAKELGMSLEELDLVPTRFLFHGPPGTGKTTTARLMAKLFFDMGYLSIPDVIEYTATDLVGQYVGHTGHKTREKLRNAVGRLVFIDNASRLLNGSYEATAVEELTQFLSEPMYQRNIVVILAGDKESLGKLTKSTAVSSVFSEEIAFKNIAPEDCTTLLSRELASNGLAVKINSTCDPWSLNHNKVKQLFSDMQLIPGWANARDVKHLARQIRGKILESDNLDAEDLEANFEAIVKARNKNSGNPGCSTAHQGSPNLEPNQSPSFKESHQTPPRPVATTCNPCDQHKQRTGADTKVHVSSGAGGHAESSRAAAPKVHLDTSQPRIQKQKKTEGTVNREDGVSDAIWEQVQRAKVAASEEQAEFEDLEWQRDNVRKALVKSKGPDRERLVAEYKVINDEYQNAGRLLKQREKVQNSLRKLGRCKYGYLWTTQAGGYRCEGGMHFVSDAEVENILH
ncbi:P-loop containing nucleoside triphosphate hydrolase protein [Xylaria sp. FL1777]|nr:P-loop containing nucleoside triphosphate hydrolase protein [Xylaria sp. FL1777]